MGFLTWQFISKHGNDNILPLILSLHILFLYGIFSIMGYKLSFHSNRLVKQSFFGTQEIFYAEINKVLLNDFALQLFQKRSRETDIYRIFDIWIYSGDAKVHFRSKWFDSREKAEEALLLLLEKCPPQNIKKEGYLKESARNEIKIALKWMFILYLLTGLIDLSIKLIF